MGTVDEFLDEYEQLCKRYGMIVQSHAEGFHFQEVQGVLAYEIADHIDVLRYRPGKEIEYIKLRKG